MIEEHVRRAERRRNGADRRIDLILVGDVGGGKHGRAARAPDLGDDRSPRFLVPVDNADLGAFGREQPRRGAAHAGCAA